MELLSNSKLMASFNVTGDAEMPDAMTIIFQKALAAGLSGAVSNSQFRFVFVFNLVLKELF